MNHHRLLLSAATTALAGLLITTLTACEKKIQAQTTRAATTVPVVLKSVRTRRVQRAVDVVGTLYGEEETIVSAKVPGRIIALYKDIGDSVAPFDPLVQLKQNDYILAVNKAQLAMEESLAKVGLRELPPKDFDCSKVPTVVKAKLQADNAEARYKRGTKLFESQPPLMSEQDYSDLDSAFRVAKSNYEVEMLNARALVAQAWSLKGDWEIANQRLTDTTTRAPSTPEATTQPSDTGRVPSTPHTYVVTARYVNVGELVHEITPCYRLVDDNPIKLRAKAPERYVSEVKVGQTVKTNVEAYGEDFWGTVSRVNPQIDPDNRTFIIEVLIPNDEHRLKAGSFARASVQTHVDEKVVFAPQKSVISFAGVNKVFTVNEGKALEINVEPGEVNFDFADDKDDKHYVEIANGLKGTESLVVSGTSKLATGVPVIIKPATTQPTSEPSKVR